MKPLLTLACFAMLASAARAVAPHPSVLTVRVDNAMLPVARVINTDPVVMVGDHEKRIRTAPTYLVQHADAFGKGYVRVKNVSLNGTEMVNVADREAALEERVAPVSGRNRFGTSYFQATMTSKADLIGGFAVVVVYPSITETSAINDAEIIVHQLPDLPAGTPVRVKITAAIPNNTSGLKYIVQVFDNGGHELATNWWDDCGKYYAMRDRSVLRERLKTYVAQHAGADVAAAPVLMPRPIMPEGAAFPKAEGAAVLTIASDGTVANVDVQGIEDKTVRTSVANALGGWLFLPQLKGGNAVPAKVKVPLQF